MHRRIGIATLIVAALFFLSFGCGGSGDAYYVPPTGGGSTLTPAQIAQYEDDVYVIVNQERAKQSVGALTRDAALDAIAQGHSDHMRDVGIMAHEGIGDGTMAERYASAGYTYLKAGENVAQGQTSPQAVMTAWMNSPGHRANILDPEFNRIGVALAMPGFYWTQNFARK
jgi:uncharacterized protein YkwD